jgi:acetylornithine deacetylase/succinyl-diaminopimelate desuccinylase-like protein
MAQLVAIKHEVELRETERNIAPAAARNSILMLGGRVEAGTNFNVTPDFCSFTIERRINPEEYLEEEKRRLCDVLVVTAIVVPLVTAWWAGRVGSPRREEELASERNDSISAAHVDSAPPKTPP